MISMHMSLRGAALGRLEEHKTREAGLYESLRSKDEGASRRAYTHPQETRHARFYFLSATFIWNFSLSCLGLPLLFCGVSAGVEPPRGAPSEEGSPGFSASSGCFVV